jgi:outer membrane protein assembly factor BamB
MRLYQILGLATLTLLAGQAAFIADPVAASEKHDYSVAYQINPSHSGGIRFQGGFSPPFEKLWTKSIPGTFVSYPVIAEGKVFVNALSADESNATTHALDLSTGAEIWNAKTGASYLGPAYDRKTLFVATREGLLEALSSKTGELKWSLLLPNDQGYAPTNPIAADGRVYIQDGVGYVYEIDEKSRNIVWIQRSWNGGFSTPALGDNGVYVSNPCYYYKFDPLSGNVDWQAGKGCDAGGGNTPIYYGGRVYVQDWVDGNSILDAGTGNIVGTFTADNDYSPAFYKTFGVSLSNNTLSAWDASTGATIWTVSKGGGSAPIVVNDLVFVGDYSGTVYGIDAHKGKLKWSDQTGSEVTHLAAGEGTLVVIGRSTISAYVPAAANGQWPAVGNRE